jgi:N-acetylmuramoyl-L-alanine amidase
MFFALLAPVIETPSRLETIIELQNIYAPSDTKTVFNLVIILFVIFVLPFICQPIGEILGALPLKKRTSPNFNGRAEGSLVDILVIHYTGMQDASSAINRLCDRQSRVGVHYLILENGLVLDLVEEDKRAWHAGEASWWGIKDINSRSIGIELINPGHEHGYQKFPEPQMKALIKLAKGILFRHPIEQRNIVGHADIAPRRRKDPGELFPWERLARAGIGLWPIEPEPAEEEVSEEKIKEMLHEFGYEIEDLKASIEAFQRHYRPSRVDGVADKETVGSLKALLEICD